MPLQGGAEPRSKLQDVDERSPRHHPITPKQALSLDNLPGAISTGFVAKCDQDGIFMVRVRDCIHILLHQG